MKQKNNFNKVFNQFVVWYCKNVTPHKKQESSKKIRNFIEKMAVWYELRYPNSEVTKKIEKVTINNNITNDIFNNNPYTSEILKNNINELDLKWEDFYNFEAFYISLSNEEKKLIGKHRYPGILYLGNGRGMHFHLASNGIVDEYEIYQLKSYGIEVKDYHIKELVKLLNEKGIFVPPDGEVMRAINACEKSRYINEQLLNCVMYRIMERSDNSTGLRRAFLFAKEFNTNIEELSNYAIDSNDYNLLLSMSEYLVSIGKDEIVTDGILKKHLKLTNLY